MFKIRRTTLSLGMVALASLVALSAPQGASKADTAGTSATSSPQQQIDQNNQQIANLNTEIATYQAELQQVGANKKTLQAAINSLDLQRNKIQAQVALTQAQINITQLQITQLGADISDTQQTILNDQAAVGDNLRTIQKTDSEPLFMEILSAGNFAQIWDNVNATLETQNAIQQKLDLLQTQKQSLANSQVASKQKQATLGSQQQSLTAQQQSLIATEQSKSQLLVETNAEESTYEKLLAAAQAELASFSTFAQNAGGSKLLSNQTQCDSWGCYYNQRDTAWGNDPLDGTQYRLASDGCLVTSMAMVMTHYGYRDVTPVTINANPNNFATYYPAYLLLSINVDGVTATRKTATIDATLATGNPVIVGLNAYGGTHYVVLVSGSNGNYIMRDPYVANGKDISFSSQYKLRSIFGISRVQITT